MVKLAKAQVEFLKANARGPTEEDFCADWLAMRAMLEEAKKLVAKLREVHADSKYQSVWTISHIHVGQYSGPTYTAELETLEKGLKELLG